MPCPRCGSGIVDDPESHFLCGQCRFQLGRFVASLWLENPKLARELEDRYPEKKVSANLDKA